MILFTKVSSKTMINLNYKTTPEFGLKLITLVETGLKL